MRRTGYLTCLLLITAPLAAAPAFANTCQTDNGRTCATGMPLGGYCECTAHGATEGGTVVSKPEPHRSPKATGGCAAQPGAPGCR